MRSSTVEERVHDSLETADITAKMRWAMSELRQTLDRVEQEIEREVERHGRHA